MRDDVRDHVRDDVRDEICETLCLQAFRPSNVRDGEIYKNVAKIANKLVQILYQMFKTRTIKLSIYSQGWERFIPNEGTFHSQRGNKRQIYDLMYICFFVFPFLYLRIFMPCLKCDNLIPFTSYIDCGFSTVDGNSMPDDSTSSTI